MAKKQPKKPSKKKQAAGDARESDVNRKGQKKAFKWKPNRKGVIVMPQPTPNGRPRKISEEIVNEFAALLPKMFYLESVAANLGLDRITWRNWLKKGRAEHARLQKALENGKSVKPLKSEELYLRFFYVYRWGCSEGEKNALNNMHEAAKDPKYWQANAWMLERRFPDRWGSQTREIRELKRQLDELVKVLIQNNISPPEIPAPKQLPAPAPTDVIDVVPEPQAKHESNGHYKSGLNGKNGKHK